MSRRLLYLTILFVLAAVLLFMPLPFQPTYAGRTIENAGHAPLFFLLTFGLLYALRDHARLAAERLYVFCGFLGLGAGFMSELIQMPLARDASWDDALADAIGVVCGLAVYSLFDRRIRLRLWQRIGASLVALACVAVTLAPIVRMVRAYVHRNAQFPVLADFHSRMELYWTMSLGVNREIVDDALEVELAANEFPGVAFHEPVPDWRRYKMLVIDVQNPDVLPLKLGVRVHDTSHNLMFNDRFNRRFELAPGERRNLRISLEDIRNGPKRRPMDMARISDITLFRSGDTGSRRLRIFSMRLE